MPLNLLSFHFLLFPMYAGGIKANARAQRFLYESLSYKLIGKTYTTGTAMLDFLEPLQREYRP